MQDAETLMTEIRKLTCEREVILARAEKRIAEISAKAQAACAPLDAMLSAHERDIAAYIVQHPAEFQRPRRHRCPDGIFGLRTSSRLDVRDRDKLLDHILDCGYDDCVKIKRSLNVEGIKTRIMNGERMPGASIQTGDIAFYEVEKQLVEEARNAAA
jgi:phage host-nuclease inhibitor protein Gam